MATKYVRAGASGSGSGDDWTNAYTALPGTLSRSNALYYIADGSYAAYVFNTAESSTAQIEVRKATVADHGTETGWDNTYGDGTALFTTAGTPFTFSTGYWLINGVSGSGTGTYGIRAFSTASRGAVNALMVFTGTIGVTVLNNINVRYVDFDWNNGTGTDADAVTRVFDNAIITSRNQTFSHCRMHHSSGFVLGWFYGSAEDIVVENCYIDNNGGGGGVGAHWETFWNTQVTRLTYRNNLIHDTLGQQGQTGWLMVGDCTDVYVYGNIFYNTDAGAFTGNNGTVATWSNDEFQNTNVYIYNNTFVKLPVDVSVPSINFFHTSVSDTNVVCKNNLFYNSDFNFVGLDTSTHNAFGGGQGTSGTSQQTGLTTAIFVDYDGNDFSLASNTTAGEDLGSPFNVDMFGNVRATWTRGAIEFGGIPPAGDVLNTTNLNATTLTVG